MIGLFAGISFGSVLQSTVLVCAASLGSCTWAVFFLGSWPLERWSKSLGASSCYPGQIFVWCCLTWRNYILVLTLYILINLLVVLFKFLCWSFWREVIVWLLIVLMSTIFCSRAFQRFAVKTNRTLESLSSKAKEVREELSEQLKEARGQKDHFKQWSWFPHRFSKMILTILLRV